MIPFQLIEWANRFRVSREALEALIGTLACDPIGRDTSQGESHVSVETRLVAAAAGDLLFRNNRGVAVDPKTGRRVRFGLANDSKETGKRLASHDLIGIRDDGRFLSVEVKAPGWRPTPSSVNPGQQNWTALVRSRGGVAMTISSAEQYLLNRR